MCGIYIQQSRDVLCELDPRACGGGVAVATDGYKGLSWHEWCMGERVWRIVRMSHTHSLISNHLIACHLH